MSLTSVDDDLSPEAGGQLPVGQQREVARRHQSLDQIVTTAELADPLDTEPAVGPDTGDRDVQTAGGADMGVIRQHLLELLRAKQTQAFC